MNAIVSLPEKLQLARPNLPPPKLPEQTLPRASGSLFARVISLTCLKLGRRSSLSQMSTRPMNKLKLALLKALLPLLCLELLRSLLLHQTPRRPKSEKNPRIRLSTTSKKTTEMARVFLGLRPAKS